MSNDQTQNEGQSVNEATGEDDAVQVDELQLLKDRAKMMGIPFSNNIRIEGLRAKIAAAMAESEGEPSPTPSSEVATSADVPEADPEMEDQGEQINPLIDEPVKKDSPVATKAKKMSLRQYVIEKDMKLVRCRITNLDPKKKDLPGEFFTVANRYLGTVRKFIPFGEVTDDGYHVPFCLFKLLKSKTFQNIRTKKGKNGQIVTSHAWVREFALEVLDPLTEEQLRDLAIAQAAAGSVD